MLRLQLRHHSRLSWPRRLPVSVRHFNLRRETFLFLKVYDPVNDPLAYFHIIQICQKTIHPLNGSSQQLH